MNKEQFFSKIYDIIINSETPEEQQKLSYRFYNEFRNSVLEEIADKARKLPYNTINGDKILGFKK